MTDENKSGQPEEASYAQAEHAYERRKAIDQYKDRLKQGVQISAEPEKAHGKEAQAAPSPDTPGPIAAVLDLLSGPNTADLADLDEAEAAHHAALKGALTSERETALRDLDTGKGSTLRTTKLLQSVPHLLDVLPDVPPVQKVRKLVSMFNARDKRNECDPLFTIGQTLLWRLTGDRELTDLASNDSSRLHTICAQVMAAELFELLNLPHERIQDEAHELRRRCLAGRLIAKDYQGREISKDAWVQMEIVLNGNMPSVERIKQSPRDPAGIVYDDVLFERDGVLRDFSPEKPSEDQDVTAPPREPSSAPSEVGTIVNLLPTRTANWTAPTKFEIVGFTPAANANGKDSAELHSGDDGAVAQPGTTTPIDAAESPPVRRKKGGNKDAHDWGEARAFFKQVLETKGDPAISENQVEGWRTDGDIWVAISEHLGERYEKEKRKLKAPDPSTVGKKLRSELEELRNANRRN